MTLEPRQSSIGPARLVYADPPYPGQAKRHYGDHPDYAGEVDHGALIRRLLHYDGWALSTSNRALRQVLALCPDHVRVLSWHKPIVPPEAGGLRHREQAARVLALAVPVARGPAGRRIHRPLPRFSRRFGRVAGLRRRADAGGRVTVEEHDA